MWRAVAFTQQGVWREVPASAIEGEPFSSEAVLGVARAHDERSHAKLVDYLVQEVEQPLGRRDAIERWSSAAVEQSAEFDWAQPFTIERFEEALGLSPRDGGTAVQPYTVAWHDRTAVIIPFTGDEHRVLVEYVPGVREEQRVERLRHRYASTDHTLETVLEWRGYFGRWSGVIDHWTTMRRNGRGFVASIVGATGFVVGTVVRRLTRPQPTFDRDPTWKHRLVTMLERYPSIESGCPDLGAAARASHPQAIVFVHGTVSCGVQGLKDLVPSGPTPALPIYRYEHDTFRPLDENARELADLVTEKLDVLRLLVAGHSRGGLVARIAASRLMQSYRGAIDVYTFGTPHLGTPLVAIGGRLLNVLFKLGEDFAGAIPLVSPLTKAYGYLCDSPGLPPGIEVMREDSAVLGTLNAIGDRCPVRSWGSAFDIDTSPSGFGVGVEGLLAGTLADLRHDLVVPTASACGAGIPEPVLDCSHVHYFQQPAVATAVTSYGLPAPPAAPSAAAASGIRDAGEYVIVGGVRVRKRG